MAARAFSDCGSLAAAASGCRRREFEPLTMPLARNAAAVAAAITHKSPVCPGDLAPSFDAGANLSAYYQLDDGHALACRAVPAHWCNTSTIHDVSCGNTKARRAFMQGAAARAWCCNRLWQDCIAPCVRSPVANTASFFV